MPERRAPACSEAPDAAAIIKYTGKGVTSRRQVSVEVKPGAPGQGVVFEIADAKKGGQLVALPARADHVVNTLRNVSLGKESARISIVEHLLAAVTLWGLEDLTVSVNGPELPLGDGSANFWIELLSQSGCARQAEFSERITLPQPVYVLKGDRSLIAVPDSQFSVTYVMDWQHPMIGKRWQTWNAAMPVSDVADARTFGSLKEHEMLGLTDDVVSFTEDGFNQELRFEDEPIRHKLLDLIGDLTLIGFNPLRLNARIVSIKAGHEMDVQLVRQLAQVLNK